MGEEESEIYREMDRMRKERHAGWKTSNLDILKKSGIIFRESGSETLLFRNPGKPRVDFYPSTGRWKVIRTNTIMGGGALKFIAWYKKQTSE